MFMNEVTGHFGVGSFGWAFLGTPRRRMDRGRKHIHTLNWLVGMVIDNNVLRRVTETARGSRWAIPDGQTVTVSGLLLCLSVKVDDHLFYRLRSSLE